MTIEVKVPMLPESVADATVSQWYKKPGDSVSRDENLVDLETDKVMLEVPSPVDGVIEEIIKPEGETVTANELIAKIKEGKVAEKIETKPAEEAKPAAETKQAAAPAAKTTAAESLSPAVRRAVGETGVDVSKVSGTGKGGRITKSDVTQAAAGGAAQPAQMPGAREEKRVAMSRLRARVAERLLEVTQTTAMLTTFNEVNMKPVMDLRKRFKEQFEKKHQVRIGFMSFFVKAVVEALKRFPEVNACIDGKDVVYHGYYDVGIAVSTERGLVVPILRDADAMSMADIEKAIREYAEKARTNKLTIEEMTGGTFTITNGGVFGSMLSTPIINPPQSAILGMHNIVERPVVENGEIVVRPIMYVALSYDHRIIDGRDSVSFLKTIKELLEEPSRILLGV